MNLRRPLVFVFVWLLSLTAGCELFPRKAELERIHDTYREEFTSTFLGSAKNVSTFCSDNDLRHGDLFPKTLQAIRDFETRWPKPKEEPAEQAKKKETSVEQGHLTVLKAMIHLQVGNTAIARSMIDEVKVAPIAVADDREVRDSLFKEAYPHLAAGWTVICEKQRGAAKDKIQPLADAGAGVLAVSNAVESAGKPVTDQGAIYLATTGAIFLRHAFQARVNACVLDVPAGRQANEEKCRTSAAAAGELKRGADAISKFLSKEELEAAKGSQPGAAWERVVPRGRLQYVQWYGLLSREAATYAAPKP